MGAKSFFPLKESLQINWLEHYISKLSTHGLICGVTEEEITQTITDITYYIWVLKYWYPAQKNNVKEAAAHKILMSNGNGGEVIPHPAPIAFPEAPKTPPPGILKRLFSQIARIKASIHYNEQIGLELGIISGSYNLDHPTPKFTIQLELGESGQRVRIDFKKYQHEGVWIECRINGSEWAFFDKVVGKPFFDERPISNGNSHETREYRMRWWDNHLPQGEWSEIQKIILGP